MPTFDGTTLIVTLDSGATEVDWQDTYSAWKDWLLQSPLNRRFPKAFRPDGGGQLTSIIDQGRYYFFANSSGWRIKPPEEDITIYAAGNLAVEDTSLPALIPTDGAFTVAILGLQPITQGVTPIMGSQLAYSSFEGGVWIDVINGVSGTFEINGEPIGNAQNPVNNIPDAVVICQERGLPNTFFVVEDLTLGLGDDVRGFKLIGISHVKTQLAVGADCLCFETNFESFDITGVLDGDSEINNCTVSSIQYFNGHIHNSSLNGTIQLSGSQDAKITNCSQLNITSIPVIDCGGSGQNLVMPNYSGRLIIDNLTGASEIGVGFDAGELIINSTCTAGIIAVSGTGKSYNSSGVGCYVVDTLVDGSTINNIKKLIEINRPHHTGTGNVLFWDPVNGDDSFLGDHPDRAVNTFAQAHNLAIDNNHDIIICIPGDPSGNTITTENVVISKNYLFVRGPGRDFTIKSANDVLPSIDVISNGVEISGMIVKTEVTNTISAIRSVGNFTWVKDTYIENSANGILLSGGSFNIVEDTRIGHNTGFGIKVDGAAEHTTIKGSHIGSNGNNGIIVDYSAGHELTIDDSVIHGNTGYGVDISITSSGVLVNNNVTMYDNSLGNVNDLGTGTHIDSEFDITEIANKVWNSDISNITNTNGYAAMLSQIDRAVHIDTEQVSNGNGSQTDPFNNLNDALTYAESVGLKILHVLADITIDRNLKNFIVKGIGTPAIDCNGQDLTKSEFTHCNMKGSYTGTIIVQESILFNGFSLNGYFENCVLGGNLFCTNGSVVLLMNCASFVQGVSYPSVSMVAAGTCELGVRGYSGGFELRDMNNTLDKCSIEPTAGNIILANSCSGNGELSLKGIGDLTNNSDLTNISDKLVKSEDIRFIRDIESGRWDLVGNQMVFYASDNITEVARFDMFDSAGNPTTTGEIYKRTRV